MTLQEMEEYCCKEVNTEETRRAWKHLFADNPDVLASFRDGFVERPSCLARHFLSCLELARKEVDKALWRDVSGPGFEVFDETPKKRKRAAR